MSVMMHDEHNQCNTQSHHLQNVLSPSRASVCVYMCVGRTLNVRSTSRFCFVISLIKGEVISFCLHLS